MKNVGFTCASPVTNSQVIERLNEIEKIIYNPFFRIVMNDTLSYYVPNYTHKLKFIRGVTVFNPLGEEVETAVTVYVDKSVKIDSNILLNNHILIIY